MWRGMLYEIARPRQRVFYCQMRRFMLGRQSQPFATRLRCDRASLAPRLACGLSDPGGYCMKLHVLASGSSGNCYCIENDNDLIFIDIGVTLTSVKKFISTLAPADYNISLFISHEHTDHISGALPFIRSYKPSVFASAGTAAWLEEKGAASVCIKDGQYCDFDSFAVVPFEVSHDAAEPMGFVVMTNHGNIGFATDLGCITVKQLDHLQAADMLVLEANHDVVMLKKGKYPYYLKRRIAGHKGHLSNNEAMGAVASLIESNLRHCLFAHVSEENNDYELLERLKGFCEDKYNIQADVLRQNEQRSFEFTPLNIFG